MPFQQMLADTNPSHPKHWLYLRCKAGKTRLIDTSHQDNPTLWDAKAGDWTEFGRKYIAKLDQLSGARKLRLRDGKWVQAEGVVYEEWNPAIHVIDPFEIPADWQRFWWWILGLRIRSAVSGGRRTMTGGCTCTGKSTRPSSW